MREARIASSGPSTHLDLRPIARARPRTVAFAVFALAVGIAALVATGDAHAQDAVPQITIEAVYPTAIVGSEDLVFDVTASSAPNEDLVVSMTLSPGILSAVEQTVPVLIQADTTTIRLLLSTRTFLPDATTGDVIATLSDGDDHDVGEPSTASVRVFVGDAAVVAKVGFSAPAYTLDESVGTTTDQIRLTVRTVPDTPVPRRLTVPVWTRDDTATSGDDYAELSDTVTFLPPWTTEGTLDGAVYSAEVSVPVSIVDDDESEGDERFTVWVGFPGESADGISLVSTDSAPECDSDGCGSYVTITANDGEVIDNDVEPADAVVVTLVHVPDGTVIPDHSTLTVGETVTDGTTFSEDGRVLFRLQFEAADGGPAPGGADVELSFRWTHYSPIVPTSGEISRVVFSLPRADVWDTAVQILDNDVGNPDSTMTARITGCWRNGCVIGEPSEITVRIADDDGGPAAAPPGPPDPPRLVCASAGGGYDSTAAAVSWRSPSFAGGAPINGYEVQYQRRIYDDDDWVWGEWRDWPHAGTAISTTITGLDTDALYAFHVRAANANGPGPWSLPGYFSTGYSQPECEIIDQRTPGS